MVLTRPRSCRRLGTAVFSVLLFSLLGALPLTASEPSSRILDSGWQFRAVGNTDNADVKQWHPAQVPGVVHTDLLHNSLIPDPFDRDNEFHLQWIGLDRLGIPNYVSSRRSRARTRPRRFSVRGTGYVCRCLSQ